MELRPSLCSGPRSRWHSCGFFVPSVGAASSGVDAGMQNYTHEVRWKQRMKVLAVLGAEQESYRASLRIAILDRKMTKSVLIEAAADSQYMQSY